MFHVNDPTLVVNAANQTIAQYLFQAFFRAEVTVHCELSEGCDVVGNGLGRLPSTSIEKKRSILLTVVIIPSSYCGAWSPMASWMQTISPTTH